MPKNCVNINYAADVRRFFRFDILEQAFIMEIGSAGTSTGASADTFSIRRRYFFMPKPFKCSRNQCREHRQSHFIDIKILFLFGE